MNVAVFYPSKLYSINEETAPKYNVTNSVFNFSHCPPEDPPFGNKRDEFLELLRSPNIDALLAWRGGRIADDGSRKNSSFQLLEKLTEHDWLEIIEHPKNIIGYSDVTYLLCALVENGINCFYGPNYNSTLQQSNEKDQFTTLKYLELALSSKSDYVINFKDKELTAESSPWTFNEGTATGRLIGGNLDTIYTLLKMKQNIVSFSPQEGDILFLEENEPNYFFGGQKIGGQTYEKLMFLKKSGVLSEIGGLILGRSNAPDITDADEDFSCPCGNAEEKYYLEKCIRSLSLEKFPVLANVACGHTHPMVTLPLGKTVTLNATAQTLTVHFSEHNE